MTKHLFRVEGHKKPECEGKSSTFGSLDLTAAVRSVGRAPCTQPVCRAETNCGGRFVKKSCSNRPLSKSRLDEQPMLRDMNEQIKKIPSRIVLPSKPVPKTQSESSYTTHLASYILNDLRQRSSKSVNRLLGLPGQIQSGKRQKACSQGYNMPRKCCGAI